MDSNDIALVQKSFHKVAPIAGQAAALFYARLFELDPSLRRLFRGEMEAQGGKLMDMLSLAVGSLDRFEEIEPVLRQLGARHVGYGVRDEHYGSVGAALLWTLERGLGPAFTPAVKAAWSVTFTTIATAMMDGARAAKAA